MAEVILRKMLGTAVQIQISSAGLFALEGQKANENAIATVAEEGTSLADHRARQLTKEMVRDADLILVMTRGHEQAIGQFAPDGMSKVKLITEYEEDEDQKGRDIFDPIAQPIEVYQKCLSEMKSSLANLVLKLIEQRGK
jgi:protein-tyrosine-phosphatase